MKLRLLLLSLAFVSGPSLPAQEAAVPANSAAAAPLTADQLNQLLGPIALYPDALIALILPASAVPADIVLAARYLQSGGDPSQVDRQPWDDSVVALAHYPDVIAWMDQNLAWTSQLGSAFVAQRDAVMQAIQQLRTEALAAGTLYSTPQQQVVQEGGAISIVPAQPDVIYVPRYDPSVVYYQWERPPGYAGPLLTFGGGFPVGLWLSYDVDWGHHRIWVDNRHEDWRNHRDWRHPIFPGQPGYVRNPDRHLWTPPPPGLVAHPPGRGGEPGRIYRPAPIAGAPHGPPDGRAGARPPEYDGRRPDGRSDGRPDRRSPEPAATPPGRLQNPLPQPLQSPLRQPLPSPLPQRLPDPLPQRIAPPTRQPTRRDDGDFSRRDREPPRAPPAPAVQPAVRPAPPGPPPEQRPLPPRMLTPPQQQPGDKGDNNPRKDRDDRNN